MYRRPIAVVQPHPWNRRPFDGLSPRAIDIPSPLAPVGKDQILGVTLRRFHRTQRQSGLVQLSRHGNSARLVVLCAFCIQGLLHLRLPCQSARQSGIGPAQKPDPVAPFRSTMLPGTGRNSQSCNGGRRTGFHRATASNSSYPLTSSEDRDILGGEAKTGFRGDAGRVPKPRAKKDIFILNRVETVYPG